MAPTEPVLQHFRFSTRDVPPIHSLPTLKCLESGQRYIPWQNITNVYATVDHLKTPSGRASFMTDKDHNVIEPLRIAYNSEPYEVIFKQLPAGEAGTPLQVKEDVLAHAENLLQMRSDYIEFLQNGWKRGRRDFLEIFANARYWLSKLGEELLISRRPKP
ncbi:hypothetical protein BGZ94_003902 [Podila epigama]|nr:hypothetical protein BGZ94_003902 [Podila epigama]